MHVRITTISVYWPGRYHVTVNEVARPCTKLHACMSDLLCIEEYLDRQIATTH